MSSFVKKILFPIVTSICLLTLMFSNFNSKATIKTQPVYTIKAYKNSVALYSDNEIIAIYDDIVLNTLPEQDVLNFKRGISVSTPAQAELYLEDFDR